MSFVYGGKEIKQLKMKTVGAWDRAPEHNH